MTGRSKDQDLIDELAAWMQAPDAETVEANGPAHAKAVASALSGSSDEMVVQKCRAADNAAKFAALFDHGDVYAYHGGDNSVADLALLGIMAFYTQDEAQLERLLSSSALGRREKWRKRSDYRQRTISRALDSLDETYDWSTNNGGTAARPLKKNAAGVAGKEAPAKLSLVRFVERSSPNAREFIVPELIPRHHPTTLYGWGGTAKSLIALLLSMSVAGGQEEFFGREIAVHGPVLYIDFELDADEQHRRVMQLAAGMKMEVPKELLYVSTRGVRTHEAISFTLAACEEHEVVMVVLDSLGPAMVGDMAAARDVIEFHNRCIAPFKTGGATPLLVDHQARQQAGEGYQSKGAFGSAYKEHLSRSLIQVEAGDRNAELNILNVRLRHKKTNFGALADPFDVSLSFSDEMIVASTRDLTPADLAQEATLNAEDRVVAALAESPAYPDEIAEATGLARGTVKNKITALKKAERVETTGEIKNQMERVRLVAPRHRPIRGSAASAAPNTSTVAGLFADPPEWLVRQLEVYREDPNRHLPSLRAAVAAEVLGDGVRGDEVRAEVERALEEDALR